MHRKPTRATRAHRAAPRHNTEQQQQQHPEHACGKVGKLDLSVLRPRTKYPRCEWCSSRDFQYLRLRYAADNRYDSLKPHGQNAAVQNAGQPRGGDDAALPSNWAFTFTAPPPAREGPAIGVCAAATETDEQDAGGDGASEAYGSVPERDERADAAVKAALASAQLQHAGTLDLEASRPVEPPPALLARSKHAFTPEFLAMRRPSTMHFRKHSRFFGPKVKEALSDPPPPYNASVKALLVETIERANTVEEAEYEIIKTEASTEGEDDWTLLYPTAS